jgi:hypothetical protein
MQQLKIENIEPVNAANAPANALKINDEVENTSKDTTKQAEEQTKEATVKHVIVYLGNGEYTDNTGRKWRKDNEYTYTDKEYADRKDLHFMVKYGEMKHTVVTM